MKKWTLGDIFVLILEILAPVASLVITILVKDSWDMDVKLSVITAGITIPIILLQVSTTKGQNKTDNEIQQVKKTLVDTRIEVEEQLNICKQYIMHISPIMERIFLSENKKIQRFAYRRMKEAIKSVDFALNNEHSDILKPNEYYDELFYLADLVRQDYRMRDKTFSGEIWAMTSFAAEEWSADQGYERRWTEELGALVSEGIGTRRLCIVSMEIIQIIKDKGFCLEEALKNAAFRAFWEFLRQYYHNGCAKNVKQYAIKESDCEILTEIRGFFGIKLSNGELHILYGETVDAKGAMTSELLFSEEKIRETRELFMRYSTHTIKDFVERYAEQGFTNALSEYGIQLC